MAAKDEAIDVNQEPMQDTPDVKQEHEHEQQQAYDEAPNIKQETTEQNSPIAKVEQQDANGDACDVHQEAEPGQQEVNGQAAVNDAIIKERLLALLADSDMDTTTEKMLRKSLEKELGVELNDKKKLIREEVDKYLAAQQQQQDSDGEHEHKQGEESAEEAEEAQPRKRHKASNAMGSALSPAMQQFLGVETMARTQVVKSIWDYIKQNNLQNPKDKRKIILDEKLATLFTTPLTMFSMNKQLSKHVKSKDAVAKFAASEDEESAGDDDDDDDGNDDADSGSGRKRLAAKRVKKAAASKGAKPGGGGAGTGFAKPLPVSDELAAATGEPMMSRGGVVKWLFAYAKERDLMDPSDKRFVLADETLKQLTGESRFRAFSASKLLNRHFIKTK